MPSPRLTPASLLVCLALLGGARTGLSQEGERPLPRTEHAREIRALIEALGAEEWGAREAARERLIEIGPEAIPYLERARRDPDAQRAAMADELVGTLRWLVPEELRGVVEDGFDDWPLMTIEQRRAALQDLAARQREAHVAADYLVTIARFDPDPPIRQLAVATYLRVTGGGDRARDRRVVEALADEEPAASVAYLRARLQRRLGDLPAAIEHAEAAVAAAGDPASAGRAAGLLVDLLLEAERYAEALPRVEAAAKARPEDPAVRIQLGQVLFLVGREEEGLAQLEAVAAAEGLEEDLPLLIRLGEAYLRCGRNDEAEALYREALGRFPYQHDLNVAFADAKRAQGDLEGALAIYLSEIRYAAPGTEEFLGLRERLTSVLEAAGAGWIAESDAFFADAHRGRPVRDVRLAVGNWLRGRGLLDEAAAEMRVVAALSPGSAEALVLLGDVLVEAGRIDEAREAYARARSLRPDDRTVAARITDLEGATAGGDAEAEAGSFAFWEARLRPGDLERDPEAVPGLTPPPLVLEGAGRVIVSAAGCTTIYGFDDADGSVAWRHVPEPPPPEEGALPEQIGLEPAALLELPAAVVAATHPRRARSRTPVVAALYNVYWRPAHRSWRKAMFMGLRAYVLDPATGEHLADREVAAEAQLVAPAPVRRRARALAFTSPRARRLQLELIDLVLARPLWVAEVPYQAMRRPVFGAERIVVAWDQGVIALDDGGEVVWRHDRAAPEEPTAGDPAAAKVTTGVVDTPQGVVFGTGDGRIIRLAAEDGTAEELARPAEGRLVGALVAREGVVYVAERGGAIYAVRVDGPAPETLWTVPGPRAAHRTLAWAGGALFSLNGSRDVYADETPLLQAFDPGSGDVSFQRPVDRPARLASGGGLVAVCSGGRRSRAGLRLIGARPKERIDARTAKLRELRSAAADALAEEQVEVSAVLAREYVRRAGGFEKLDQEALAFVARTLARSNRTEEALDLIHLGEELGGRAARGRWDALRREVDLEVPELPEPKVRGDGAAASDGAADGADDGEEHEGASPEATPSPAEAEDEERQPEGADEEAEPEEARQPEGADEEAR